MQIKESFLVKFGKTGSSDKKDFATIKQELEGDLTFGTAVKEAFDLAEDEVEERTILLDIVDEAFVEELKETYEGDAEDPILKDTELFKKDNGEDDAEKKADYEKKCLKSVMKSSRFKMPPVCREMFDKKLEKGFAENEFIIHGQDGGKLVGDDKFTDEARWKKKKKTVELEVNKVLKEVADSCKIEGGDQVRSTLHSPTHPLTPDWSSIVEGVE